MKQDNLVEAFEKVASRECDRLNKLGAAEREASMHLQQLAEYANVLDLEAIMQELHHEYINS
jgi:hypothetical protein